MKSERLTLGGRRILQSKRLRESAGGKVLREFIKDAVIGGVAVLTVTITRASRVGLYTALADGLFTSGAILCSLYALGLAWSLGGFDIFSYSLGRIFGRGDMGGYAAYTKRARRTPRRARLLVGAALILASLPLLLLCV